MSRYLIDLPENHVYRTRYKVVYSDINAANHLGADRVLPIALEAQFGFIRSLGYEDAVVFENAGLIMANSQIDYLSETRYGAMLDIRTSVRMASEKSLEFTYAISNADSGVEVARVKTLLLFFDYGQQKVTRIPDGFRERLQKLVPLND